MELIERCLKLLEVNGREPEEWPVPISREDLRELIEEYAGSLYDAGKLDWNYTNNLINERLALV